MGKNLETSCEFKYWIDEIEKSLESGKLLPDYYNEGYKIGRYSVIIDKEIGSKLKVACKDSKFLIYSFLVASMEINLSKYMHNDTVTVGIPFYDKRDSNKIACSKILPLITNIDYKSTYKEFMIDIKNKISEIYKNQEFLNKSVLIESKAYKDIMELTSISICMRSFHEDKYINYIKDK